MRTLPLVLLSSCAFFEQPKNISDVLCFGGGIAMAQVENAPGALPGFSIDLSQCFEDINIEAPLTCEEAAQVKQWITWTTAIEAAAGEQFADPNFKISIPMVLPEVCE